MSATANTSQTSRTSPPSTPGPASEMSPATDPVHPTGPELAVFEQFPQLPLEIRNKIVADMVNKPRLLIYLEGKNYKSFFEDDAPCPWIARYSHLPPSLFLNQEIYAETLRHINLVPEANEDNANDFPWSYINPKFDVAVTRVCEFAPRTESIPIVAQVPGLQTLALLIDSPWVSEFHNFEETIPNTILEPDFKVEEALIKSLHELPDLKEVILLRETFDLSPSGKRCDCDSIKIKEEYGGGVISNIKRHPCGYFGALNEEIEAVFAKVPKPPTFQQQDGSLPYQKPTEQVVAGLTKILAFLNEDLYPGTQLPKISAAYLLTA